jgi:neutral ceramidase
MASRRLPRSADSVLMKKLTCALGFCLLTSFATAEWRAGVAKVNITPGYPVMLSGYGSRKEESKTAKVDLWAKALVLSWDNEEPTVLLTVDNCGVPEVMRAALLAELAADGVKEERLNLCSSHTHCAPALSASLKNLYAFELDAVKVQHMVRYTAELQRWMVEVCRAALKDMAPAKVEYGVGRVGFAKNRRLRGPDGELKNSINPDGPVDHDVPVLKVSSPEGAVRAVFSNYACHCTTLNWNYCHPDWAGLAQLHVEMGFMGCICLTATGCGGDQNPHPRHDENSVRIHGFELGKVIRHTCASQMKSIEGPITAGSKLLELLYAPYPGKEQIDAAAKGTGFQLARHASFLQQRIAKQEGPGAEPYLVQTLSFGTDLAMVFLNGEVVVDYSLRLKRELAPLWVNAYSNNVQGYIPSERVLKEGGYEGGGAMVYYLKPGPFAPGLEDKIVGAVRELLPGFVKQ